MDAVVATEAAPKATRREWIGLAVIALPCVLYSMDLTVLNLAVPQISADLRPSSSQLLWIVDIYGFLLAGLLIPMGTLGDRIGRRRLLMIGAGAFGVGSVAAAFSTSAEMLIATRAMPSSARVAISISALFENAAAIEAMPKAPAPIMSSRRRPIRSPSVPIGISSPASRKP